MDTISRHTPDKIPCAHGAYIETPFCTLHDSRDVPCPSICTHPGPRTAAWPIAANMFCWINERVCRSCHDAQQSPSYGSFGHLAKGRTRFLCHLPLASQCSLEEVVWGTVPSRTCSWHPHSKVRMPGRESQVSPLQAAGHWPRSLTPPNLDPSICETPKVMVRKK